MDYESVMVTTKDQGKGDRSNAITDLQENWRNQWKASRMSPSKSSSELMGPTK
jgi:hypothetical protein